MEKSNIDLSDETSGLFADLPPAFQARIKNGFSVLAEMSSDHLVDLVEVAKKSIGVRQPPFEKYASTFNLPLEDVVALISAAVLAASLLSTRTISAEEFALAAVEEQVAEEVQKDAIFKFAQIVLNQAEPFIDTLERSRIASQILPSFASLDATIDVRLRFEEGQVRAAVPVVVLSLSTDKDDEEIVFQTTREGIDQIIEQLQDIQSQLQTTEEWARQHSLREGE